MTPEIFFEAGHIINAYSASSDILHRKEENSVILMFRDIGDTNTPIEVNKSCPINGQRTRFHQIALLVASEEEPLISEIGIITKACPQCIYKNNCRGGGMASQAMGKDIPKTPEAVTELFTQHW
ncbi:hypothetical protein JW978_01965 [Candidatus Dojkabacteria bacterium]|nr:hypothetical protein [Candidatus Dojkabacteria bacterium]